MKNPLLSFFILVTFMACSQNSLEKFSSAKGYSFRYSMEDWKVEENESQTFVFNKQKKSSNFNPNLNVLIQDLPNQSMPMSLEDYHLLTLNQIKNALGENSIQSNKNIKISEIAAKEIVYTMPPNFNNNNQPKLKLKQVYFIKNDKAYLITYTAEMNEFSNFITSANEVFESFKVK
ncbi:hypothetical protein [Aequorivita lipolytica]|uniref:PsbP C-terminal domain-containing protein n=1 Tax=Aequorivita lipolytica TaxID=153267 RepID=A0A5C6YLC3_9FLAO|nr:hypothetical protein [Aequorivita lipolytica]TXD68115.1 hypothetical protein ESV24_13375 [Aequorivita lipolytica]SRX53535.1 hypothetical protein AEQU2_02767 [Aequorivita lipolytica]